MPDNESTRGDGALVKSAERTLAILETLSFLDRPVLFSELQADLGYPRSSLHGLLTTLERSKWIERDPTTQGFMLGMRAWEVGMGFRRIHELEKVALPIMQRLSDALGETVQLAVLDGSDAVYVAKIDGRQTLRLDSAVGRRIAAHATGVGKALLASLTESEQRSIVGTTPLERFTESTITNLDELIVELVRTAERGFALDNEERTIGAACVAVPITNRDGVVCAAISVSAPVARFDSKKQRRALAEIADAAVQIGRLVI